MTQLQNGDLDAVAGCCLDVPPPCRKQALFSDSMVLAVDQEHPDIVGRNGGRKISREAYLKARHVQAGSLALRTGPVDQALEQQGHRRDVAFGTRDYRSAIDMLAGSELVLTLPARVFGLLGRRELVALPLPFVAKDLRCDAVWDGRCDNVDGLKWFTSLLVRVGASQPDGAGRSITCSPRPARRLPMPGAAPVP